MSGQIIAKCKCGIESTSLVGGGMHIFKTVQHFPAACRYCANVVQVNAKSDKPQCPLCGSIDVTLYNDTSLIGTHGSRIAAQSFNLELSDGTYKCPGCGEYTLRFFRTGLMLD